MKALSVREPYASMIVDRTKWLETRNRRTRHRGPLLIVTSKHPKGKLPTGHAVAVVELTEVRRMSPADERGACVRFEEGLFVWVLTNVRPIEPFPVRGQLGIYEVDVAEGDLKPSREAMVGRAFPDTLPPWSDDGGPSGADDL